MSFLLYTIQKVENQSLNETGQIPQTGEHTYTCENTPETQKHAKENGK